jgi:hypothetical protein
MMAEGRSETDSNCCGGILLKDDPVLMERTFVVLVRSVQRDLGDNVGLVDKVPSAELPTLCARSERCTVRPSHPYSPRKMGDGSVMTFRNVMGSDQDGGTQGMLLYHTLFILAKNN